MDSFEVDDAEMMSAKFQIYSSNIQGGKRIFKLHSMYGNAITENALACLHNIVNISDITI